MVMRLARWLGSGLMVIGLVIALAWATSPDPRGNTASFETDDLRLQIAPLEEAITLAQVRNTSGVVSTLLVTRLYGDAIDAIDLSSAASSSSDNPFEVLASLSRDEIISLSALQSSSQRFAVTDLLPAAPTGSHHIGTGTNFPEHAAEASSSSVFLFPKFGKAMPARSRVTWKPDVLLDYEVEICMRFDRKISSADDFAAAKKGLFLCGDFTDRSELLRLIDPENLDSGRGFSDGKSRLDFFPSGALLVIPGDWEKFVAEERMTTSINGELRQDARGGEMTLNFRELALKALGDMKLARFLYDGAYYKLGPQSAITPEMTLMSGTAEGVIFTAPTRGDVIEGVVRWLFSAGWARGEELVATVIETFIANELKSGHFLQPNEVVEYRSSRLGDIIVTVSATSARTAMASR